MYIPNCLHIPLKQAAEATISGMKAAELTLTLHILFALYQQKL